MVLLSASFLLFFPFLGWVRPSPCPAPKDLFPCSCEAAPNGDALFICANPDTSSEDLARRLRSLSGGGSVEVTLRGLRMGALPQGLFRDVGVIRLTVDQCEMDGLSAALLDLRDELEELNVSSSLSAENAVAMLDLNPLRHLTQLEFSRNEITELDNEWSSRLPATLRFLSLLGNRILTLGDRVFAGLNGLRELRLTGNRFGPFRRSMLPRSTSKLHTLDLEDNALTSLPRYFFSNLPSLRVVNLRNNGIVQLQQQTWQAAWQQLDVIHLEDNPLACDSHLTWMFNLRLTSAIYGTCQFPSSRRGISLQELVDNQWMGPNSVPSA